MPSTSLKTDSQANRLLEPDRPVHEWYRFVLSYPAHLVRDYFALFGLRRNALDLTVLDPFCGTGTTLVEAKKLGLDAIGIEANPVAAFASRVKTDWNVDARELQARARTIAAKAQAAMSNLELREMRGDSPRLRDLDDDAWKVLSRGFISPVPLHRTLVLRDYIDAEDEPYRHYGQLALAKSLVTDIGNVRFGPEIGVGARKSDAPVVRSWLSNVEGMCGDLMLMQAQHTRPAAVRVVQGDARRLSAGSLDAASIDAVITSPPYPNEKDYTRTTRLESVVLGFLQNKAQLREMKDDLLRSNTRNVFVGDRDLEAVAGIEAIAEVADAIERRRLELGKTSGFERLYHKVTLHYFGGIYRHLESMRTYLKPGARCAYVVGDQASYFQIMIRTGHLLADVAERLGYEVEGIELFRTRAATATRQQLREEVVVLRWPS